MGGVSDSVNANRTSPAPSLPSASALIDLLQPEATAGWSVPQTLVRDQAGLPVNSAPTTQPQLQALALMLNQTSAQSLNVTPAKALSKGSSEDVTPATKPNGGTTKKTLAAKQFQLARKLYDGDDELPPFISIVG